MVRILLGTALFLTLLHPAIAEAADDDFARWEKEIAALERRNAENPPAKGGVVFVGSSSIRLWDLAKHFPDVEAVNQGFGGSTVADSVHFVDRLVLKLAPKTIVLYAGDNDIAQGKSPQQVHADFQEFVQAVHAKLPEAKIVYLPIKPSPSRWKIWEQQNEANQLIKATVEKDPERLKYVDTATPMLGDDGQARRELFQDDLLHLNEQGYALWTKLLKPQLEE